MKIGLFYGGRSFEREISVVTALQAMDFIPKEYELIPVYMNEGKTLIVKEPKFFRSYENPKGKPASYIKGGIKAGAKKINLDCALIATHGGEGENGVLQSLLEYYEIPFTSSDHFSSAMTMDKALSKRILSSAGLNVAKETERSFPCIVKPRRLGSSIGIRVAVRQIRPASADEDDRPAAAEARPKTVNPVPAAWIRAILSSKARPSPADPATPPDRAISQNS